MASEIENYYNILEDGKKNKLPAKLDFAQSATGLFLAIFMWGHMLLVSSILVSEEFMYDVTKFLEGKFIFGSSQPMIVSIMAGFIFIVFIVHAFIAFRKLPNSHRQYVILKQHNKNMKHKDTNLWIYQAYTGFAMFFLGSIHLYIIMTNPSDIGPYASSDRIVSDWMWPLYILLLLAVEVHGTIGLYRLCLKWGWFEGKDAQKTRKNLKKLKIFLTIFFLGIGFLSLAAYIKIGLAHQNKAGEKYIPQNVSINFNNLHNYQINNLKQYNVNKRNA
jgi:fumarate reductase subunit C